MAVHGGGGAEHDALATELRHHLTEGHGTAHIVVVILQRLLHRFAHRLQPGEMDHGVNSVLAEHPAQAVSVPDIAFIKREGLARQLLYTAEGLRLGVVIIVHHHDIVACGQQFDTRCGCRYIRSRRNKYCHFASS